MNRLMIIGASGHGKVVADIAELNGYKDIVFLDDNENIKKCSGYPVIGKSSAVFDSEIIVAVGNTKTRKQIMEQQKGKVFPTLIHPRAVIADRVDIKEGSVVMAGVVINTGVRIGRGCIVNTSASIDHDCMIGDFCHVSVGVLLSGNVSVGDSTWIGAGAVISNNINICSRCVIGAGTVVIKDIDEPGTYAGVPAKMIECR